MGKDTEWKTYFEDNRRYADIINGIGCGGRQVVKDTDLADADTEAKGKARDLIRRTAFGANFALIGIENQDGTDYGIPLRNMSYDAAGYQKQAREIRKEVRKTKGKGITDGEYLYGFRKTDRLHPIITFLLYSGPEEWQGPERLHDMLDFSELPESLKEMTPDYPVNVIDIRRFANTDVFQTDVKQVFDFIRCSNDRDALWDLVNHNEYYKEMDEEAFDVVTKYTNSKDLVGMKSYEGKEGKKNVCKAIEDLIQMGREEGRESGFTEGRESGLADVISNMLKDNLSLEQICKYAGCNEAYVKKIQEEILSDKKCG